MLIKIGDAWVDPNEITLIRDCTEELCEGLPGQPHPQVYIHLRHGASAWISATMDEAEAALIDAGVIENPYPDEPPELTEEEREELKALFDQDFEYLARDGDGKLYAYKKKPTRDGAYWDTPDNEKPKLLSESFDSIGSDDEDPWAIDFLLLEW